MDREDKSYIVVWILFFAVSGLLWLVLIGLKAFDIVSMEWLHVLLGVWWIPLLLLAIAAALAILLILCARMKRYIRKSKVRRRIKRQRKALERIGERFGVEREPGERNARLRARIMEAALPAKLEGEALERAAWKDYKIYRMPGESDEQLRRRCMKAADEEYANTPK